MSTRRALIAAAAGVVTAGCGRLVGDHAAYSTPGDNAPVAYRAAQRRAREAGYRVVGPFYVNARDRLGRSLTVPVLTDRYGTDARLLRVTLDSSPTRGLEAGFTDPEAETRLVFVDDELASPRPFRPRNLPPDDWLLGQFRRLFGIDAASAAELVASVRQAAAGTDDTICTYRTDRRVAATAIHRWLADGADRVTARPTTGDGWVELSYDADESLGTITLVVPSVRIVDRDRGHTYTVKLDREGGFWLLVTLPTGERIPDEEYRTVFRTMFETLGLPADRVADYTFTYTASNW